MARVEIAALREQRSEIVVGLGQIRLQDEGALERGAGPDRLPASGEQRAQTIQRRRARVRLGRALERHHRGTLESAIEKFPAVRQVVAERQSGIERSLKGQGSSEALGRRHVDRARVLHDLVDVHAIAVDLHDVAAPHRGAGTSADADPADS